LWPYDLPSDPTTMLEGFTSGVHAQRRAADTGAVVCIGADGDPLSTSGRRYSYGHVGRQPRRVDDFKCVVISTSFALRGSSRFAVPGPRLRLFQETVAALMSWMVLVRPASPTQPSDLDRRVVVAIGSLRMSWCSSVPPVTCPDASCCPA
jgi:hypothetical protein